MFNVLSVLATLIALTLLAALFILLPTATLFLQARHNGARVSCREIIKMRLRKSDVPQILRTHAQLQNAGIDIEPDQLETHALAGGDIASVTSALTYARTHDLDLPWQTACDLDLAPARLPNVLEARRVAVELGLDMPWDLLAHIDHAGFDPAQAVRVAAEHGLTPDQCQPHNLLAYMQPVAD